MTVAIQQRPDGQCDLCGEIDELRPYGPNGEWICFDCGMKDRETTKKIFNERLDLGDEEFYRALQHQQGES